MIKQYKKNGIMGMSVYGLSMQIIRWFVLFYEQKMAHLAVLDCKIIEVSPHM